MKNYLFAASLFTALSASAQMPDTTTLLPVEVVAVRAGEKTPVAKTNISKEEIKKLNVGQDLPFILSLTPSMVVSSDAGNGVGYTYMKLRGSDASRINVTLNGIPYNDAESQGTFFVDLPDFASSASSIQVQRGVGTSSNGAGAFGGSINLSTNERITKRNIELNNVFGSYATLKNTLIFNSGTFAKNLTFDARLSRISSDGYMDRASSKLYSFYTSLAWMKNRSSLRLNVFSGKEKTYQAWNGVPEEYLDTNRTYNSAGTEKPGSPYKNEIDDYLQTHYQLFFNQQLNTDWKLNLTGFYVKGKGFYEQYKAEQALSNYGLPVYISGTDTTRKTDIVRRLWLNNDFYGGLFSVQYDKQNIQWITGGGYNMYDGKHYGRVIWAEKQAAVPGEHQYYFHTSDKKDLSLYSKATFTVAPNLSLYADVQVRNVNYKINGFKNNPDINIDKQYTFVNPKAGIYYKKNYLNLYASYARAQKEPNRDDFEANVQDQPKAEQLNDFEAGVEHRSNTHLLGVNLYYMLYKNQLIPTGKINDVGAYTRMNIPDSYRRGIELIAAKQITDELRINGNLTLSQNEVEDFTEYLDDWDNGGQIAKKYSSTDIAFSPAVTGALQIDYFPLKNLEINTMSKYVGKQYLDNTSNDARKLNPYFLQDIRAGYTFDMDKVAVKFFAQANNVFNKYYEANGYTYSYVESGVARQSNYYFPMAPFNWLLGLNIRLK